MDCQECLIGKKIFPEVLLAGCACSWPAMLAACGCEAGFVPQQLCPWLDLSPAHPREGQRGSSPCSAPKTQPWHWAEVPGVELSQWGGVWGGGNK